MYKGTPVLKPVAFVTTNTLRNTFFSRSRFQIEIWAVVVVAYCSIFLNNSLWNIFIESGVASGKPSAGYSFCLPSLELPPFKSPS
ncbi:MAG: hypothetical protein ACKO6R_01815 [Burkholderiaceae bacterium]